MMMTMKMMMMMMMVMIIINNNCNKDNNNVCFSSFSTGGICVTSKARFKLESNENVNSIVKFVQW